MAFRVISHKEGNRVFIFGKKKRACDSPPLGDSLLAAIPISASLYRCILNCLSIEYQ